MLAGGDQRLDLAVALVLVRRHQQRAQILEQRRDRRLFRALVKTVARHFAPDQARAQRRFQFQAHAVRMVAGAQRVDEQHRQRDGAHVVEAQQRDRARHRRDGRAGRRAVAHRVRQAQDALGQRDVGQHVVCEVVGALVVRRGHLHDARDGAAECEHLVVAAHLLQQRGAHAAPIRRRRRGRVGGRGHHVAWPAFRRGLLSYFLRICWCRPASAGSFGLTGSRRRTPAM